MIQHMKIIYSDSKLRTKNNNHNIKYKLAFVFLPLLNSTYPNNGQY